MTLITPAEFTQMEALLADLLPNCSEDEDAQLLQLHARLQAIYVAQAGLKASRDRLVALAAKPAKAG
ncbi:hypothetical protein KBY28_12230 [Ruegeria pomeroyi]|uniref:hypothetical protein n=1 Tax=Ruegeria pomeroyi TaxID=89184 RepID=UPI001F3F07B2|nr:hypothetical protein [Ruegeria pomeroyi]MCE8509214.1 hypothetical protein [Ruegeria pomeroyi]